MKWLIEFTVEQLIILRRYHVHNCSLFHLDAVGLTIDSYHKWCDVEGVVPITTLKERAQEMTRYTGKYGIWLGVTDQEELTMKALYRFYGVNKRTGAFMDKMVVGHGDYKKALNTTLLSYAAEITLNLGDPEECVFQLVSVIDFEPIEDGD